MSLLLLFGSEDRPSKRFVKAAFRQETDEVACVLLTIDHPTFTQPARVCSDSVDLTSRGNLFVGGIPFTVTLPDQDSETLAQVRLSVDVIDQELSAKVQSIPADAPPTVTMELVLASVPDVVEAGPFEFTLRGADGDITALEGDLAFEDMLHEPFPNDTFTPASHPGLF